MSRRPLLPAWKEDLAPRLVRFASRCAPPHLVARLEEEWLADLSEQASVVERWQLALGCCWAALMIQREPPAAAQAAIHSSIGATIMTAYANRGTSRMPASPKVAAIGPVICDINTTPLIDVLLVLLVTLIVTLPIMTHAVKLDLPHGPPPVQEPPPALDLAIDFDGTVVWNGTAVAFENLDRYFSAEAVKVPQPEIHLHADRRARYDVVARVLASAQRHRMQRIGFIDTGSFKDD
jgi:biopolymer transport protein ExbD